MSCSSLSKTYSITGWRLGYTIAPEEITDRIKKVHDFLTVGAAAPLAGGRHPRPGLRARTTMTTCRRPTPTRRDLFLKGLKDVGLEFSEPQGAYYVLMDISAFGYEQ
ncbi:MAG: aminotransferase class I/II-fold pyridoxal phosphate-dependent enzyme [Evtepia sp.]